MPVADTSLSAYDGLRDFGDKQRRVLDAVVQLGVACDRQIADHLGWTINRVTPRRGELVEAGIVVSAGYMRHNGRRVKTWREQGSR